MIYVVYNIFSFCALLHSFFGLLVCHTYKIFLSIYQSLETSAALLLYSKLYFIFLTLMSRKLVHFSVSLTTFSYSFYMDLLRSSIQCTIFLQAMTWDAIHIISKKCVFIWFRVKFQNLDQVLNTQLKMSVFSFVFFFFLPWCKWLNLISQNPSIASFFFLFLLRIYLCTPSRQLVMQMCCQC